MAYFPLTINNCVKSFVTILTVAFLGFILGGCAKSDEKSFSGAVQGNLGVDYQLVAKYAGEGNVLYTLNIKPKNPESFHAQLNIKRHEEVKRRMDVLENLKKYCEESKIQTICNSLNMVSAELNVNTVDITCNVQFYDRKNNKIDSAVHNIVYDLNSKTLVKTGMITIESKLNRNRTDFDKITHVEIIGNS